MGDNGENDQLGQYCYLRPWRVKKMTRPNSRHCAQVSVLSLVAALLAAADPRGRNCILSSIEYSLNTDVGRRPEQANTLFYAVYSALSLLISLTLSLFDCTHTTSD